MTTLYISLVILLVVALAASWAFFVWYLRANSDQELSDAQMNKQTEYVAKVSHEIRSPLATVIGFAGLLESNHAAQPEVLAIAQAIRRNSERLLKIADDILDLSRLELGQFTIEPASLDLYEEINSVILMFAEQARKKNVKVKLEWNSGVPRHIWTDGTRLQQILTTLLSNAVKFTENGDVLISARYETPESNLLIDFIDNGIGIAENEQTRLFRPFTQANRDIRKRYGGNGLGLAMGKSIARCLNGDLRLTSSKLGSGSHFTLQLKLIKHRQDSLATDMLRTDFNPMIRPAPPVPYLESVGASSDSKLTVGLH